MAAVGRKTTKIKNIAVLKFVRIEEIEVFKINLFLIYKKLYKNKILALGQRV